MLSERLVKLAIQIVLRILQDAGIASKTCATAFVVSHRVTSRTVNGRSIRANSPTNVVQIGYERYWKNGISTICKT